MYIQDMSNTKGHVAAINDGCWFPTDENRFCTASMDGSIRVWDIESKPTGVEQQLMHEYLIKVKDSKGLKVPI